MKTHEGSGGPPPYFHWKTEIKGGLPFSSQIGADDVEDSDSQSQCTDAGAYYQPTFQFNLSLRGAQNQ
jgi:hypothetical protein